MTHNYTVTILLISFSLASTVFCLNRLINDNALIRNKRQAFYYLCGTFPNQYYSTQPCSTSPPQCTNGGRLIGVGCTTSIECTPFHTGTTQCLSGCCCTVPDTVPKPLPDNARFGICYHGQLSESRCSGRGQCANGQTCMNGLCCTTTGEEYNYACGGQGALSSCTPSGSCSDGAHCTPSNYCCECTVGTSSGRCGINRSCPSGFTCQSNGFCCSSCPGNVAPYGSCRNGTCGGGKKCSTGNICC